MSNTIKKNKITNKKTLKKTLKNNNIIQNGNFQKNICIHFMKMLNCIKLYHWKTRFKSHHDATDELHDKLLTNFDRFMEIIVGKSNFNFTNVCFECIKIPSKNKFKQEVNKFINYLIGLNEKLNKKIDTDLIAINDEIIGDLNKFKYSIRLK
tara:strand:+ start:1295 stop:1750 length:456 start_codon:yes stop_codon:yes gene_type:complete